ncbi:MAG TPA: FG-GAP-like repeat-containing protein [candidate division Zixibacteria bacterium]
MKKQSLFFLLIFLFILLYLPQSSYSIYSGKTKQAQPQFSPTRLIVKLKPEVDKKVSLGKVSGNVVTGVAFLDSLNVRFDVRKQERLFKEFKKTALKVGRFSSIYTLEVPEGTDLRKMKEEYERRAEVEYVELDYKVELFEQPNDPLFAHQWYLDNTGAAQNEGQGYYGINRPAGHTLVMKFGTTDADIDALEAFQRADEKVIPLVGIIDTGVDLDHEDLKDNIWVNPGEDLNGNGIIEPSEVNGTDDDHNGFVDDFYGWDFSGNDDEMIEDNDPTDYFGHGTHCAGIVAAVRNNGIGVSGINTPCRIMAIKFFPNAFMSLGAKSIIYAADMGCDVINMSWGAPYPSSVVEDAIDYAVSKGVLPIAAAGNSGAEDNLYPASLPQVLAVGASNSKDEVTYFSTYGNQIEVVAPGEDILSLRADNTDMYEENGYPLTHIIDEKYYLADGTSMASPCAVGVAAYILSASPGISNDSVISIMEQSADDIIYPYGGDSLSSPGKDIYSGYGRVNLNSALALISGRLSKIDYPYENTVVSGEVAIIGTASGANFVSYILEYGEGASPQSWTQITSSTTPVAKDTLGIFNASGLTGLYSIRLTVGDQNQVVVHVIVNSSVYVKISSPQEGDTIQGYTQISGYTIIPGFSYYTLEYGQGESPSSWTPIDSSTKIVADYILGNWLTSFLNEGNYTLRLTAHSNTDQTYADSISIFVKSITSGGWIQDLSSYGSLSPAIGDIDGDGYDEIVVGVGSMGGIGTPGGVEVFSHDGQREAGWPKDINYYMSSSPALGDLDNDGIDDIVICSNLGVHAYLSSSPSWFRSANTGGKVAMLSFATPVLADLENDGYLEVLTINDTLGIVYAWHKDGQPVIPGNDGVFAQAVMSSGEGSPCLTVTDLDRDGKNEVIVGAADWNDYPMYFGGIYIWDIEGNLILGPGDYPDIFGAVFGIAIANVDENEDLEIVTFGENGEYAALSAFKKDGTQVSGYPIIIEDLISGNWLGNPPAIGDLDGDGILEIVVSVWTLGEARIYAWHQDGTPLGIVGPGGSLVSMKTPGGEKIRQALSSLGNNLREVLTKFKNMSKEELNSLASSLYQDPVFASVAESFGSPVLADVNEDGNVDILARAGYVFGSGYERVFAWDYDGREIDGWPLYASAQERSFTFCSYSPIMADVDKDGKLDMVLGTEDPKLTCWKFINCYDSTTMPWPKYLHDKWNSGRYGFKPTEGEIVNLPPYNFHVKSSNDSSVTLAWNPKPSWASLGYNIYRATTSGEPGDTINTNLIPQPDSQYQDLGLDSGQTYYYTITNVDTNFQESDHSREISAITVQPFVPLFDARIDYAVGSSPRSLFCADLDGDSDLDLAVANAISGNVSILKNNGEGTLQTKVDYDVTFYAQSVFCADLDGDGDLDLAVANSGSNSISILRNDGDGTFQTKVDYAAGSGPRSVFCADVDGDSDLDLAVANYTTGNVSILKNNGDGTFETKVDYGVGIKPISVFSADLDGDLDFDLAVANSGSNSISILRNNGDGTFEGKVNYGVGVDPYSVFCADLDGDLDLDLAVANGASNNVSILFNQTNASYVGEEIGDAKPSSFILSQNYPNPFNSETVIEYSLPKASQVKIAIYNILGQKVTTLLDKVEPAGFRRVIWDGKNQNGEIVSSGIYFYRIEAEGFVQSKKMLLLK